MNKIELPISINYVPDWGLHEALRELYQNSIDRKNKNDFSPIINKFYKKNKCLLVGNKQTSIATNTLILGNSQKGDGEIGKYGEGYKLALIVLLRLGHEVTIYNYNQIWKPRIIFSEQFECDILSIEIEENGTSNEDLVFAISNITPESFKGYEAYNLLLQPPYSKDVTSKGEILNDEKYRKKIFVEGLYVCTLTHDKVHFGYNFKAGVIKLDRDRSQVAGFDIFWLAGQMIGELDADKDDLLLKLLEKETSDIEYFTNFSQNSETVTRIGAKAYESFKDTHGVNFFPGSDNEEDLYKEYAGIKVKRVPKVLERAMRECPQYKEDLRELVKRKYTSPEQILKSFYENNKDYFPVPLAERFCQEIMSKAKNWRGDNYE
jgi:hypothetical protein